MTSELKDKVILITGASRGIGYHAAKEAGRRGAHVVAVARTVGGLEELDDEIQSLGGSTTLVPLDLRDGEAIDRLGAAIFERFGRLDGLLGNAAMLGGISPLAHIDPKDFERTFAINVTANFRLIRAFDLPLRQSPAGRAVFVTSGAARNARAFWGLYSATKAALEALCTSYAREVAATHVRVNLFNPGPLRTAMRAKAVPGENPQMLKHPSEAAPLLVDMLAPGFSRNGAMVDFPTGESRELLTQD